MASTLNIAPPARAFSGNPIFVELYTDVVVSDAAYLIFSFSSTGPAATNGIRIQFAGNDLLFVCSATNTSNPLDLPIKGAETLAEYAALFAARMMENEVINTYFKIEASGTTVTLLQRVLEIVDITIVNTLTNTTVTVNDVTSITTPESLRALVQVWTDTGNILTDALLLSQHAPYPIPNTGVRIDISSAFAALTYALPAENTINPTIFGGTQPFGLASAAFQKYYLRHADKSGIPAVAEALVRTSSYIAQFGHLAADSLHSVTAPLRHAYQRRDKSTFIKPTSIDQPDYLYWVAPTGVTSVYIAVTAYWSDGTESAHTPYGTTGVTVVAGNTYHFPSGYWQNKLHQVTPTGGTAADAYITGYRVQITRTDGGLLVGNHGITHQIMPYTDWEPIYLLYENGVGGCETVALRGKPVHSYKSESEEYNRDRGEDWTIQQGDYGTIGQTARTTIEANTGWVDPFYLEHLRQLPLSTGVFLIDIPNRKFRRVTIAPGELEYNRADETLQSLSFTIRAAWGDIAANV
jgi:hypothetical protein